MWKCPILLLLIASSASAWAQPAPEILRQVEKSYSPAVANQEKPAGHSLSGCELLSLAIQGKDPVDGGLGALRARVYLPYAPLSAETRSVILLPPTGGENFLDRGYADSLCRAGFRVVLVQSWPHDTDTELDLSMHDKGALRALAAVRRVLDYLSPQRPSQVGILGTSIGAITAALALGFDSRLNSGALIVGGLAMPEIIAATTEAGAVKLRAARMKHFGFQSPEAYLSALKGKVRIDPADFADFSGPKKVLAYVGTEDLTVPTANQERLVTAFRARREDHPGNHGATIFHTYLHCRPEIAQFFEQSLR